MNFETSLECSNMCLAITIENWSLNLDINESFSIDKACCIDSILAFLFVNSKSLLLSRMYTFFECLSSKRFNKEESLCERPQIFEKTSVSKLFIKNSAKKSKWPSGSLDGIKGNLGIRSSKLGTDVSWIVKQSPQMPRVISKNSSP